MGLRLGCNAFPHARTVYGPPVLSFLKEPEYKCRIFLRLAELCFMSERPPSYIAALLFFALVQMNLADMHKWPEVVEINAALLHKTFDFIFFSSLVPKSRLYQDYVEMTINTSIGHFDWFWQHMCGEARWLGRTVGDREILLETMCLVRLCIGMRFGRTAKGPFDPTDILDPGLLVEEDS